MNKQKVLKRFKPFKWNGVDLLALPTKGLSRDEWLGVRQALGGLGGSEIGTVLGMDDYKSKARLFYEKVGFVEANKEDNKYAFLGRQLEDNILEWYQYYDGTGMDGVMKNMARGIKYTNISKIKAIIYNPDYPFAFFNIDAAIEEHHEFDGKGIVDAKRISYNVYKKYGETCPPKYIAQLNHYGMGLCADYGEIAAFVGEVEFEAWPFKMSSIIQQRIVEAGTDFVERVEEGREIIRKEKSKDKQLQLLCQIEPECPIVDMNDYDGNILDDTHRQKESYLEAPAFPEEIKNAKSYLKHKEDRDDSQKQMNYFGNLVKKSMRDRGVGKAWSDEVKVSYKKKFLVKRVT